MENNEKLFQLLMDHTHSWEYLIGKDAKMLYVAPSCEKYTGYTAQDFIEKENLLLDIAHPDDKEKFINHVRHERHDKDSHTLEFRIIDINGNTRWLSHTCQPLYDENGELLGRRASNHEITDYKEEVQRSSALTEQLKDTSSLLNAVLDAIPDVIGVQDLHHHIIRYNKAGYEFLGMEPEAVHGQKCHTLIGHYMPCDICATSEVYKTGKTARKEKYVPELDSWLDVRAYPVLDENGNLTRVVEHLRDISREKKAEHNLKEAHVRLITILDSIEAHVYVADLETHTILFMNRKMKEDFKADHVGEVCHVSFRNEPEVCDHCTNDKLIDEDGNPRDVFTWESYNPLLKRWYMNYDRAITWVDGRMVKLQIATDITIAKNNEKLRNQMVKQLQQSQKFEAIGTLAGGIAHDFNNLLTGILGQASLTSYELPPTHSLQKRLSDIVTYTQNATDLTNQLLGFARGGKYEVKPVDVNEVLVQSSAMFSRTKKELTIHTKLTDPPPVVEADQRQIEQVLLNLYINAWQAMPDGGELYLETKVVTLHESDCEPYHTKPGTFVMISVADTGIGMEQATTERIFDPFFTTKEKGRGTGLGLASAYGIIKNHQGIINVSSRIGEGSTFTIYLPQSEKKVITESTDRKNLAQGNESVLLVDDEEMVIDIGKDMLEMLGYRVLTASSGQEAISFVEDPSYDIDLVILDLIMPGLDGGKTFRSIHDLDPTIPVILSSGYSRSGKAEEIMKQGCKAFIQKPYNYTKLSTVVRNVLDETS